MNKRYYKKSYDNDLCSNKPYDNELYGNKPNYKPNLTHNELIETNIIFDPPKKDAAIDILDVTNKVELYGATVKYNDFVRVKGYIYKTITYTTTKQEHLDRMNKYHEENMRDEKESEIIAQNGADCGCNINHNNKDKYECKKHDDNKHHCDNDHDDNKHHCDNDCDDKCCKHNDQCYDEYYCNTKCNCNKCNGFYRGYKNIDPCNNGNYEYNANDDRYYNFEGQYIDYDTYDDNENINLRNNFGCCHNNNHKDDDKCKDDNEHKDNRDDKCKNGKEDKDGKGKDGKGGHGDKDGKGKDGKGGHGDKDDKGKDGKGGHGDKDHRRDPKDPKNGYVAIDGVIRHTTAVIPFDVILHMEGAQYGDSVNCELSFLRNSQGSCIMVEENNIIGLKETDVICMNIYLD